MKKKLMIAGALFLTIMAAVGVLAAAYFMQDGGVATNGTETWEVTNYSVADVSAIHICSITEESYTIVLSDADAYIEGIGQDVPLQEMALLSIVSRILRGVSYLEPIPVEASDLDEYGLTEPQAIFTIEFKDGGTVSLQLGNQTVKKNGYYLLQKETQTVYIVENVYQTIAGYGAYDYIDPILAQIPQEQQFTISELSLSDWRTGETITVALKSDSSANQTSVYSYMVTYPEVYDASDDKLRAFIFNYLTDFQAESIYSLDLSAENLANLGLAEPTYTLEIDDVLSGNLRFDFTRLEDGTVLVLMEGRPVIYQVAEENVPYLGMTLDQFVSPFITLQPIMEVDSLTVFDGENTHVFILQPSKEDDDLQVMYGETEVDTGSFRKVYSRAATIYISGMADPPEEKETVLRLTYHRTDGEEHTVEFLQLDGRFCYALLNGEGRFSVRLTDVEYFLDGLERCLRGEILSE